MATIEKRPWWLKRWVKNGAGKLDNMLFSQHAADDFEHVGSLAWFIFVTTMVVVFCMVLGMMFMKRDNAQTLLTWAFSILFGICVIKCFLYLKDSLSNFPSTKVKVCRVLFTLSLSGVALVLGIYGGQILLAGVLIASIWTMFFGGKNKSRKSNDTIYLSDGTELKREMDVLGNDVYTDSMGRSWSRNGDSFTLD